ncbi:MAG TPA: hypothetical protein GYA10_02305 [Alphaproteobacteria bacterium]|nr:hypothetical protein [Alphaproteobacteria bacterium]
MRHSMPPAADLAPLGSILAIVAEEAATALTSLMAGENLAKALDRCYGKGKWFVFWDEDLRGKPIRGTITLAYGKETLVIG